MQYLLDITLEIGIADIKFKGLYNNVDNETDFKTFKVDFI